MNMLYTWLLVVEGKSIHIFS